ncbi:MAG: energy transducer TonB [Acidobacteria bacterium]|nr:energy transducer TonB [Acidobacteriota bacterium]
MTTRREAKKRASFARGLAAFVGAIFLTLLCFLILPVMQSIGNPLKSDMDIRDVDVANLPPPPPPPAQEEVEKEEEPPEPPKLAEEAPPLDLSQLELALNPGFGGEGTGAFTIDLGAALGASQNDGSAELDDIFSAADLDQRPRPIFQRQPTYPAELRKAGRQGTVHVLFMVDTSGRVLNPKVEKSTDPAFEKPALDAVRSWRFEPGTRKGQKVQFTMRIPITFSPN